MDEVILVNSSDEAIGTMEKMAAHQQPILHRAFSIFLFNDKQELLLQQRALNKYHSGGLWTNTCCSHPRPGEGNIEAAKRRLVEEMGIHVEIKHAFNFIYQAEFDNGLFEHEYDHVFTGTYNGDVPFNQEEISAIAYKSIADIKKEMAEQPELYTAWFKIAFPKVEDYLSAAQT